MPFNRRIALSFLTSLLTVISAGCNNTILSYVDSSDVSSSDSIDSIEVMPSPRVEQVSSSNGLPEATNAANPTTNPATASDADAAAASASNFYQQGIDRASSAFTLSRSAQSQDDWKLVARRWQQAIDFMASVPSASTQHNQAQQKVAEYRRNLTYAQQQASRSTVASNPDGTVVIRPQQAPAQRQPSQSAAPALAAPPVAARPPIQNTGLPSGQQIFHAPIIRREGNTPVIRVTFNGSQSFDMIVDTGASGTLITEGMAQALGVTPVAATRVDTASERGVLVPLGYVTSMEVNGAVAQNVLVAIAGPQLGTGLLGHDFFGNYDVTIRETEVEFRER